MYEFNEFVYIYLIFYKKLYLTDSNKDKKYFFTFTFESFLFFFFFYVTFISYIHICTMYTYECNN